MATDVLDIKINPFYLRKITHWCKCVDVEGTGIVTKDNFQAFTDRYKQVANLDTLRERQVKRKIMLLWDYYFSDAAERTDLTPEVFGQCLAFHGTEQVISSATNFADVLFDLIDINADGVINLNEFISLHKLLLQNEKTAVAAFKALDTNNDGVIGYEEFSLAVVHFFRPDIEEETPDAAVFGPLED